MNKCPKCGAETHEIDRYHDICLRCMKFWVLRKPREWGIEKKPEYLGECRKCQL